MRRITRKTGLALAAAAVLALGQFAARQATATVVFDSNGFETANGYTTGNALFGQPTTVTQFGALNVASQSSSAISVVSSNGVTGNAVQVNWTGTDLGASPQFTTPATDVVATLGQIVTITSAIKYETPVGGTDGPFVGLTGYGNNGNAYLGAVGVDAATGELAFFDPTSGGYNTFADDQTLAADTYATFSLTLNFVTGKATASVNGASITSETFTTDFFQSASSFYAGYLGAGSTGGPDPTSATAFFDNYAITAVPEPGTLSLIGLAGIGMLLKRSRRSLISA